MFEVNNKNNQVNGIALVLLLLTLNVFHTFFYFLYCWLWAEFLLLSTFSSFDHHLIKVHCCLISYFSLIDWLFFLLINYVFPRFSFTSPTQHNFRPPISRPWKCKCKLIWPLSNHPTLEYEARSRKIS